MSRELPVVAIDGPAGAGKSTVTRGVARALSFLVLDTGAIYRSVALLARMAHLDWSDVDAIAELARELARRSAIEFRPDGGGGQCVWVNGQDVSAAIRTQEVSEAASRVSSIPEVRSALLDLQRSVGRAGGVVVEGRDIGSVVFPDAEAKFFLTASVAVRAKRRFDELIGRGAVTELALVAREVEERDERDRNRAVAPLIQAPDAILVDSSEMTVDEAIDFIVTRVRTITSRMQERN